MQRLTGLDAAFLSLESPVAHMHVMGVAIVDPAGVDGFDGDRVRAHLLERLPLIPPFRRRLLPVPFGLHYPLWVEDPEFDIDYHFQRAALPSPGGPRELAEFAAAVAGRPLDRTKPLWEMHYVEGLEGGRVGIVSKIHHSAIDGLSGVDIMAHLFDLEPTAAPRADVELAPTWEPDHVPNDAELLAHAVMSIARQPVRIVKTARKMATTATHVVRNVRGRPVKAGVPLTAPKLTMNGMITPHRKLAFVSVSLPEVKRVKDALGVKVNDVLLALATGALRTYLQNRDELPDRSLVVSIPTSVRSENERNTMGNRVSAMFASLPVEIDDPLERIRYIHESMDDAKDLHDEIGANTLADLAELASPAMLSSVMRMVSSLRLTDRFGSAIHNAIVSNVPGPPFPLYLAGARLEAMHPLGPIFDGAALNLTVISYLDSIDFGFLGCRELLPDLDALAHAVPDALAELLKIVDTIEAPTPSAPATTRRANPTPRVPTGVAGGGTGLSRVAPRSVR
ncbi:MAG TPA: wax ester/triacylglycerol synthase family O-acyltransferase [Acidimicrobiia bacterium]